MSIDMRLTNHARQRLVERTKLSVEEFVKILGGKDTTPISEEKRRTHILFYSPEDRACFVAVVDRGMQEVVTIRYPEQARYGAVTLEAMEDLRNRYELQTGGHVKNEHVKVSEIHSTPQNFHFLLKFEDFRLGSSRFQSVKIPVTTYPECVGNLESLQDIPAVHEIIKGRMFECRKPGEFCHCSVWVKLGRKVSASLTFEGAPVL